MKRTTLTAGPFLVAVLLLSGLITAAGSIIQSHQFAQSPAKSSAVEPVVTIPFELSNRHIILKVQVNNSRPLNFIFDTGDKYAIIDLDRARELGLKLGNPVRMGGAGAETPTGYVVQDSNFILPGLAGFTQPVHLALPIKRLSAKLGRDFDGIIGHDFIKNFVVEIDYQARHLRLHDKDKFSYAGKGESIPVKINGAGHPIVEAAVVPVGGNPISGKFVIDVGSGLALALHTPTVNEHKLLGPNLKTIKALGAGGAGGRVTGELGRVAELRLGNFKISEPIALFSRDTAGAFANSQLLGNIGGQVINRFRVFLDYNRDRIILEPNSDFGKPYDRAFSGISMQAEGNDYRTFRITDVLESSPASEVGLQKDDIITEVNGTRAEELTLPKLNDLFERPTAYEVTIRRGSETVKVKLTPRRLV